MTTKITYSLDIVGIVLSCGDHIELFSHIALAKEVEDVAVVFTEDVAGAMVFQAVASRLASEAISEVPWLGSSLDVDSQ